MNAPEPKDRDFEQRVSRVATGGVIIGLVSTGLGMLIHSVVLGGAGILVILLGVVFARPIARLLARR